MLTAEPRSSIAPRIPVKVWERVVLQAQEPSSVMLGPLGWGGSSGILLLTQPPQKHILRNGAFCWSICLSASHFPPHPLPCSGHVVQFQPYLAGSWKAQRCCFPTNWQLGGGEALVSAQSHPESNAQLLIARVRAASSCPCSCKPSTGTSGE